MKAILMSIKPKWVAKILNGEKTIEIRKRFPNDYCGWVYIYCTKNDTLGCIRKIHRDKYICGRDFNPRDLPELSSGYEGSGKVVARFWCDKVEEIHNCEEPYTYDQWWFTYWTKTFEDLDELLATSCLYYEELHGYLKGKDGYAIHISKLEIFDKPLELSTFDIKISENRYRRRKAPQSWCYVEVFE